MLIPLPESGTARSGAVARNSSSPAPTCGTVYAVILIEPVVC
jgi:hypothetical protein